MSLKRHCDRSQSTCACIRFLNVALRMRRVIFATQLDRGYEIVYPFTQYRGRRQRALGFGRSRDQFRQKKKIKLHASCVLTDVVPGVTTWASALAMYYSRSYACSG
jgi:hypothetical protein